MGLRVPRKAQGMHGKDHCPLTSTVFLVSLRLGDLPGCRDMAGQSTVFIHERGTLRLRGSQMNILPPPIANLSCHVWNLVIGLAETEVNNARFLVKGNLKV